jgi:hypothetical protein
MPFIAQPVESRGCLWKAEPFTAINASGCPIPELAALTVAASRAPHPYFLPHI